MLIPIVIPLLCGGTLRAQVVQVETVQPHEVPLHCLCLSVQEGGNTKPFYIAEVASPFWLFHI